jgi:RNA polymerase sigma-70 factor, ECF subfamily
MHAKSNEQSDIEIVHQVLLGDVNAFEHILNRYQTDVLMIVKRHIPHNQIEEIVQDVFVRAYQSLPTLEKKGSLRQWLSTIAVRTCYDLWRRHYKIRELPMSSLSEGHRKWMMQVVSDQSERSFSEAGAQNEAKELLDWALDKLSAGDRMVLELIYLEGLSVKEAAKLLGLSVTNVKVRSFRSRKRLNRLLTEMTAGG